MKKFELNLERKIYQKSVIERVKKIDFVKGSKSPFVVELDPTTQCNLSCVGCISDDLLNKKNFSRERLLKLGEELIENKVKAVILIGGGEPLCHPSIGELIELLGKNNIKIGLTTNGVLIDKYINVISKYCTWTRISVDAATDETFKYLRADKAGNSRFDKVVSNMRMLAKTKVGKLGYSFLMRTEDDGYGINKTNITEIYEAGKLAKDIGCDYFEVKPSYNADHFLVVHKKEHMEEARIQIKKLYSLEDEKFEILKSVNLEFALNSEKNIQPKKYHKCAISELRTLITPLGMYVCPYFRGREDMRIGDLHHNSFSDIWNGEGRKIVMSRLDTAKDCKMHCIRHTSNIALMKMQDDFENIEVIEDFNYFI